MYLIIFVLLLHGANAVDTNSASDSTTLNPAIERLANAIEPSYVSNYLFQVELTRQADLFDISIDNYTKICYDAYVSLKLSPEEEMMIDEIKEFRLRNRSESSNDMSKLLPITHSVIETKEEVMKKLSADVLPESKEFLQKIEEKVQEAVQSILNNKFPEDVFKDITKQYVLEYNRRSWKMIDLEQSICLGNIVRWTTAPFWKDEELPEWSGLKVCVIIEESRVASSQSVDQVKKKFMYIAKKIGMNPQEYVDNCAVMMSAIGLSKGKAFSDSSMGVKWGKKEYNSSEELLEVLKTESAPFFKFIFKSKELIHDKMPYLTEKTQLHLRKAEGEFPPGLLAENNRSVTKALKKNQFKDWFSKETVEYFSTESVQIEVEKVFCAAFVQHSLYDSG